MEKEFTAPRVLVRAAAEIWGKRLHFMALALVVFATSTLALGALDLLPEPSAPKVTVATGAPVTTVPAPEPELPVSVSIAAVGLSATVANPETTEVAALDRELLKGAVRYPTSARLGEVGNMVLFGHSSYLPIVGNPAYKTFNNIQKLKEGDLVEVSSEAQLYVYRVTSVSKENAEANAPIPLTVTGQQLTLVTCNSFGKKSDRFVVVAEFVESHPAHSSE